jgi:hypothetical protein
MVFDTVCLGVASNNSLQVAVGGTIGHISVSYSGGDSWNSVSSAGIDTLAFGVCWSGSLWVVGGQSTTGQNLVYSTDGNSWFNAVHPINSIVYAVAYNYDRSHRVNFPVNRIVAGGASGGGGNVLSYSNNGGLSWTNVGNPVLNNGANGVAFANNIYLATGAGTSPNHSIAYSYNGVNWFKGPNPFTSGRFIAYGNRWIGGGTGPDTLASSVNNGTTWVGQGNTVFSTAANNAAYSGSVWSAVGDGATHTIAYSLFGGGSFVGIGKTIFSVIGRGIVYAPNQSKFVACGQGASFSLATSPDGANYTGIVGSTALCPSFNEVAYNGTDLFMAVGGAGGTGNIATSPDGEVWTSLGFLAIGNIIYVAWCGDKWVICGSGSFGGVNHRIAYSTNAAGTSWVSLGNSQFVLSGESVAWNGSLGNAVIPASSIVLNSTNSKKLDFVPAPYGNGGYNNITITVKT